jgi:acyl-coenzyme A synthetase/AMP-(fatty) acid ligase
MDEFVTGYTNIVNGERFRNYGWILFTEHVNHNNSMAALLHKHRRVFDDSYTLDAHWSVDNFGYPSGISYKRITPLLFRNMALMAYTEAVKQGRSLIALKN